MRSFGYVVIDEAQNLTPMELRMVVRPLAAPDAHDLGDIAQRTTEAWLSTGDQRRARRRALARERQLVPSTAMTAPSVVSPRGA